MNTDPARALEDKILANIPLSRALSYHIAELRDTGILVTAPLEPNINIHGTGFAGSLYGLGILTAWGLGTHLTECAGLKADLVVSEATIRYRAPVRGDIVCSCEAPVDAVESFINRLVEKGRARIPLKVEIGDPTGAVIDAQMHASLPR